MREETLRGFVQRHRVTWSAQLLNAICNHTRVQVGFEIELRASHGPSPNKPSPGCAQCQELFARLTELAKTVLPPDNRPSRYEIGPFDHSFHLNPAHGFHPEISLRIRILHRRNYFGAIDDCQSQCLNEIEGRLVEIGAQKGEWRDRPRRVPREGKPEPNVEVSVGADRRAKSSQLPH